MTTVAFVLLGVMLGAYVLLDGYDLGIAAVTPLVARSSAEREASMRAIGPFWNGNEVWLIAAGGALFALFPKAYASAFSGFYLPFVLVLWLLMARGIAMELRGHFPSRVWRDFWDFCFTGSSVLLILLYGIALGNLVRGVPLDADGYFTGTFAFLLNPYALGVALLALAALAQHGATFLALRLEDGPLRDRALRAQRRSWPAVVVLFVLLTVVTLAARLPHGSGSWTMLLPVVSVAALIATKALGAVPARAFAASCVFLAALLASAAATMYPYLLPGFPSRSNGIDIANASPSPATLGIALAVTVAGTIAVIIYSTIVARRFRRRVAISSNAPHQRSGP